MARIPSELAQHSVVVLAEGRGGPSYSIQIFYSIATYWIYNLVFFSETLEFWCFVFIKRYFRNIDKHFLHLLISNGYLSNNMPISQNIHIIGPDIPSEYYMNVFFGLRLIMETNKLRIIWSAENIKQWKDLSCLPNSSVFIKRKYLYLR